MPAEDQPDSALNSEAGDAAEEEVETITPEDTNIALHCVYKDNLERFLKCFEDEEDAFHEAVNEQINERDEFGKSPLELAAILGRVTMIKELATRGAEVNAVTVKGSYVGWLIVMELQLSTRVFQIMGWVPTCIRNVGHREDFFLNRAIEHYSKYTATLIIFRGL